MCCNLFEVAHDFGSELPDSVGTRGCGSRHMGFADSKYTFPRRPLLHLLLWRRSKILVTIKVKA